MCRACSGKWAGSNPGVRCPSQRGQSRREYQNARNARIRAEKAAAEVLRDTPDPDSMSDADLASMPVADFLDVATPQQVVQRFADTGLIYDVSKEDAKRIADAARDAVPELQSSASEAFREIEAADPFDVAIRSLVRDANNGDKRAQYLVDSYLEEVDTSDPDILTFLEAVEGLATYQVQNMLRSPDMKDRVNEAKEAKKEVEKSYRYESSVRQLGNAIAVMAMASAVADGVSEVDVSDAALDEMKASAPLGHVLEADLERIEQARKSESPYDDDWWKNTSGWTGQYIYNEASMAFGSDFTQKLRDEALKRVSPSSEHNPTVIAEKFRDLLSDESVTDPIIESIKESSAKNWAIRELRIRREKVSQSLLAGYRSAISEFSQMSESDDWTPGTKYRSKNADVAVEAMGQALPFFPQSYVEQAKKRYSGLRVVHSTKRAHFSPSGVFSDNINQREFVQVSGEYNKLAVAPSVDESPSTNSVELSMGSIPEERQGGFFLEDTKENRRLLRERAKAYNAKAKEINDEIKRMRQTYSFDMESYADYQVEERFEETGMHPILKMEHTTFGESVGKVHEVKLEEREVNGKPVVGIASKTVTSTTKRIGNEPYFLVNGEGDKAKEVAIHEFGHVIEHANKEVSAATAQFLMRRTEGETPVQYEGGDKDERVVHDGFTDPYIGKMYYREGSTEVFTMAMESLLHGRYCFSNTKKDKPPTSTDDPEHRDLILGILAMSDARKEGK